MRIKLRPDDASVPETNDWLEMNDWIVGLRDDRRGEPPVDGDAIRARSARHAAGQGVGEVTDEADPQAGQAQPMRGGRKRETAAAPPAKGVTTSAGTLARGKTTERAPIGDQLRKPIAWCEMGYCVSHHADPAALGEADIRARAISVGWRVDALGRLACPECQQSCSGFWASHPVALWDRNTAIVRAALMAAATRNDATARRRPAGGHQE